MLRLDQHSIDKDGVWTQDGQPVYILRSDVEQILYGDWPQPDGTTKEFTHLKIRATGLWANIPLPVDEVMNLLGMERKDEGSQPA